MNTYRGVARFPNAPDRPLAVVHLTGDLDDAIIKLEHRAAEIGGVLVPGSVTAGS